MKVVGILYLWSVVALFAEVLDEFYQTVDHQLHSEHHSFQLVPGGSGSICTPIKNTAQSGRRDLALLHRGYANPNCGTWVVVYVGQELQVGSEVGEVGGVTGPLQNDGQLLDTFGEGLWGLQLWPETRSVKTNAGGRGSASGEC